MPTTKCPTRVYCTFETVLGWMGIVAEGDIICRLSLAHPTAEAALNALEDEITDHAQIFETKIPVVRRIRHFAEGQPDDFRDIRVNLDYLTPLGRAVFRRCRSIPFGQTRTYGQLAAEADRPGAARAVGQFMASNRTPLIIPCHRVVGANGTLGGFTAPGGISLKRRLLQIERGSKPSEIINE